MAEAPLINEMTQEANLMVLHYPEFIWISKVLPSEQYLSPPAAAKNSLFDHARSHVSSDESITILLIQKPHFTKIPLDDVLDFFSLSDLCPTLGDFFSQCSYLECGGGRVAPSSCPLPFAFIDGWNKFRIQLRSAQDSSAVSPSQTVQAVPPSSNFPGCGNTVLIRHESGEPLSPNALGDRKSLMQLFLYSIC